MNGTEEFLEHHGIKGQKWGIRNKSKASADHTEASKFKKKPISQLSNQQLNIVNNRLGLEQNYNRLNPRKIALGQQKATTILGTLGVGVAAYTMVKSPAGQAVISLGKKYVMGRFKR